MERAIISSIKDKDSASKSLKREENAKGQRQRYDDHITQELTIPKRSVGNSNQGSPNSRLRPFNQVNLRTHRRLRKIL
jgi:hypothetical protein